VPAGNSEVYDVRIETRFRPCCRTKMSACQGYRRRDLAHRPEQEGQKVSEAAMQKLIKIAFKG